MTKQISTTEFSPSDFVKTLSTRPGVYRMLGADNEILYVGKAGNLKARVNSYFSKNAASSKTHALVKQIRHIGITLTDTEADALLLESNLIKEHRPRYNILLRDDKSYPYIYVSEQDEFPRITFYRGSRKQSGRYFGPYPSAASVRDTINTLQKVFRIRQCDDIFFKNRTRPCLQYQIKRCTAPCTGLINREKYYADVKNALLFLEGKNNEIMESLVQEMDALSKSQHYEQAGQIRDRINTLRKMRERLHITGAEGDIDVIACVSKKAVACVQVFFIRNGYNLGNKPFYPRIQEGSTSTEVLSAFIAQYYPERAIPEKIIVSEPLPEQTVLVEALSQHSKHAVIITHSRRGNQKRWIEMALANAEQAVNARLSSRQNTIQRLESLQEFLQLETLPERIECFDISHTSGEATVAACVVFDQQEMMRNQYRRFNIKDITAGDDYAAMRQALERRYTRLKTEDAKLPDILLIDGGKGQVAEAQAVLESLQIESVFIIGVAKGADRIPGKETLVIPHLKKTATLSSDAQELHLIQSIRDEAHRFAITGHRAQRAKKRTVSPLQTIKGLGAKRRQALLKYYGGLQGVMNADINDLSSVQGISLALAKTIYSTLHDEK